MWQDSCDARFLWKRQGMWKRSAASHINLQSHWTQDVFYLRKHTESGRVSATHVLVEKRYGIRARWVAGHMNLQSQGTQDAFYLNSHVMMPAPAGCRFFFRGKTRLTGIARKFQSWNKGICWPRSTVSKGIVGSCDSHRPKTRVTLLSKKLTVNLKKLPREDMICGNACVCIRRCDLWKRWVVNKHHQSSCCGQDTCVRT